MLGAKNRRRLSSRTRFLCRLLYQIHGQIRMLFEAFGGHYCEYWTNTLPSSPQSHYFPFQIQILACYSMLVEIEYV